MSKNGLTRPKLMGMTDFQEFASEIYERVGLENGELLNDIDLAMNTDERMPYYLDISRDKAMELAKSSGIEERKFLSYLAFLYEIEYRKVKGPKLWERKRSVVPCPDFLPPTRWQIRFKDMTLYKVFTKIWNVSLIVAFAGAFPFMIGPVSNFISSSGWLGVDGLTGMHAYSVIAISCWFFFVALFFFAFLFSKHLRNKR